MGGAARSRPFFSSVARRPALPPRSHRPSVRLAAACIIAAGLAAYANSFTGVFVFDDEPAILENRITSLWPLTRATAAPRDTTLSGRPVSTLTFALNDALAADARATGVSATASTSASAGRSDRFPREPWGYHAVNLSIHILAALTLFGIVRRTLTSAPLRNRFGRAANALALVIAAIWVVHPLQTGSVTYIVQRVESLMGLFYLLTLDCAIRAWEADEPTEGRTDRRPWIMASSIAACACGMGSKEVMVTAPLMVGLWDAMFGTPAVGLKPDTTAAVRLKPDTTSLWSRWPLYAGLAATWAILAVLAAGGPRTFSVGFGFPEWPWWTYLLTQAGVIVHYLRLAFVPYPLVLDYEWPPAQSLMDVAPQALFVPRWWR